NEKKITAFAKNISSDILQLHTGEYRSASQLPEGNVLVTGSAQSGSQIAEDLAEAGRKVYLSTSMVARIPRRYRGKDIVDWLMMMNVFDVRTETVTDPKGSWDESSAVIGHRRTWTYIELSIAC